MENGLEERQTHLQKRICRGMKWPGGRGGERDGRGVFVFGHASAAFDRTSGSEPAFVPPYLLVVRAELRVVAYVPS